MALTSRLRHRARPVRVVAGAGRVEGRVVTSSVVGDVFSCMFFPPGTRESGSRGRVVEQAQLITGPLQPVLDLHDRVEILEAAELDRRWLGVYEVDGPPQELGKPGGPRKAVLTLLKRVPE
jgi:hypothetical protein